MPFQPAMDEPSKAWPLLNLSSSKCETGTVMCCCLPRVSVKRKSTNLTSLSFTMVHDVGDGLCHQILLVGRLLRIQFGSGNAGSVPNSRPAVPRTIAHFALSSRAANGSIFIQINISRFECTESVHYWTHHFGALLVSHQFGAQLDVKRLQALQQGRPGRRHADRCALHAQFDVAAVFRMIDTGQAEHTDARMLPLDRLHQWRQGGLHRAKHDDGLLHPGARCEPVRGTACRAPIRPSARPSPKAGHEVDAPHARSRRVARGPPRGPSRLGGGPAALMSPPTLAHRVWLAAPPRGPSRLGAARRRSCPVVAGSS
jgi:hypothetical protein